MVAETVTKDGYAFVELGDDDLFQRELSGSDHLHSTEDASIGCLCPISHIKKMVKKVEVQYTPDIERILKEIADRKGQLEVTHTISLAEVKCDIEKKWKPPALKEFNNLTESKKAFTVKKRHELPANCRIVPCKGVYTVKPDKAPPGYRRKTRFVACGNHVQEDASSFDLFAAGSDATSLRTMLAFNARKPWRIGTTGVRQAFVLARWSGEPVALEPRV